MKKFRCFLDFEKEENWLNEIAEQGWQFCRVTNPAFLLVLFICEPQSYYARNQNVATETGVYLPYCVRWFSNWDFSPKYSK